jgi:nitroreductase
LGPVEGWPPGAILVGLTSIHWREAWKYGERGYRYCQHDLGHAIGSLRYAAALLGWRAALLPWSDADIAALLGLDRDRDFAPAEREAPGCVAVVMPGDAPAARGWPAAPLVDAARRATWQGAANLLSRGHVEWPIIDEVAAAAIYPGGVPDSGGRPVASSPDAARAWQHARHVILGRRSALAFNPAAGALPRAAFLAMLRRTQPGPDRAPWDVIDWPPMAHLILFVHRVDDLVPGVYAFTRDASAADDLQSAMRREFLWERVEDDLYLLLPTDVTWVANRLSCDQDIAGDGFFSLAMLARFESALTDRGDWFYRRLFWECGLIGQVLYLEAEAAGARATGIGCFYDDPVHEALGLTGPEWQSLYHFSMGAPVEDTRLTTEPGYEWEAG